MKLRDYQLEALRRIHECYQTHNRVLLVMPTGSGKSAVMATLCNHASQAYGSFSERGRTLVLVNRKQLLRQNAMEIQQVAGIMPSLEQGENAAVLDVTVVVASVDSLVGRLPKYPTDHFSQILIDEAHVQVGKRVQKILSHFTAKVCGVTATPRNTGARSLSKFYDICAYDITMLELIKRQYLAPIVVAMCPLKINIEDVPTVRGDLEERALASSITPYFEAIIGEMHKYPHRKWLCFLPLIETSKEFCEALNRLGFRAEHVDYEHDNSEALEKFRLGKLDVVTCSTLLHMGYNEPSIDGIVNLRQTKSINFYEQLIGRGTRKSEDTLKHELLVLDFLWQYADMGLVRPSFVLAQDDETANEVQRRIERSAGPMDLVSTQEAVERDIHAKLVQKLKEQEKKRKRVISLLDVIKGHESETLDPIYRHVPTRPPSLVSQAQMMVLEKHGLDVDEVQDSEHAARIIQWLHDRIEAGLASMKQLALLRRLGMKCDLNTSFKEASWLLDKRLAPTNT